MEPVVLIHSCSFSNIDSLYLSGEFQSVSDSLLSLLVSDSLLQDEILFRILGLYHGRAMEEQYVSLLDSLEMAGFGPLTGWKVSALDLGGTPENALIYVSPEHSVLYSWLSWQIDSLECLIDIPEDPAPWEVYAIVKSAPAGSLSTRMLGYMLDNVSLFPSFGGVICEELRISADSTGSQMPEILSEARSIPGGELLYIEMLALADSGSFEFWESIVNNCSPASGAAVEEILQRYPDNCIPHWDVVDHLVETGDIDLAREYAAAGDSRHRTGSDMAFLLKQARYTELLQLIGGIGAETPDSLRARAALFRAHALRGSQNHGSVHYPAYIEFAAGFPQHMQAREAAYNAGKYYDCEQEWSSAADAYLVSLNSSGSWEGDERAHWRGGFSLYMSGRFIDADSLWRIACDKWPSGYWRDEMLFWRGRLAGELGREYLRDSLLTAVATEHPWEFYGMLAARRQGISDSIRFPAPAINLMKDEACSLAVEMTARGFGAAAVEMLSAGTIGSPSAKAAALSLMGRHGDVLRLLRTADSDLREFSDTMLPDSLLCFYFPAPYRTVSLEATDTLDLEADILQGIMREESYFDRLVVSRAGAMGVIQLMPGTAHDVARWYELPYLEVEEFFDPSISIPYGALYIDRQHSRFNGEIPLFLAAYNAGPGNASRWIDMHGWNPADPELYIEQITYRETRMYVKKVQRSAWIYERR